MARTVKLFRNGRSQAVRLPSDCRFEGSEVDIRRDGRTDDVILSKRPESWGDFFLLTDELNVPKDLLADRGDKPPQKRKDIGSDSEHGFREVSAQELRVYRVPWFVTGATDIDNRKILFGFILSVNDELPEITGFPVGEIRFDDHMGRC